MHNTSFFPVIVLTLASVLWGLTWMPLKYFYQAGVEGIPLVFVSQLVLTIFIFPVGFEFKKFRGAWVSFTGIAIAGGSAILCFSYALMYGNVIRVMVLFYLLPVWGVVGGGLFLKEKIDGVRWLGVAVAILGAYLILGGNRIFASPPTWLDFLALMSGIFFAANNLCFRGAQALNLPNKLFSMFAGSAVIAGGLMAFGVQGWPTTVTSANWVWLIVYALSWLFIANLGAQWAVTKMEAGRSSIIIITELVAAVMSTMIMTNSNLSFLEWCGCLLVVIAALMEALRTPNVEISNCA